MLRSRFTELLASNRKEIHDRWIARILAAYPQESAKFIGREKDRFRNPIGSTLQEGTTAVLDALEAGGEAEALRDAVEGMIRLRAVQVDKASEAVSFIPALADVVKRVLGDSVTAEEVSKFETRMEVLLLDAFDTYMQCREKVFEIRLTELRNRTFKLLEREGEVSLKRGADR
ncbi:MAG: RsbRD N-terminal domain-containing protein [Planctomycetota bacterium]